MRRCEPFKKMPNNLYLKTLQELQKAALRKSHQLLRCQVVATKRCHYVNLKTEWYMILVPFC